MRAASHESPGHAAATVSARGGIDRIIFFRYFSFRRHFSLKYLPIRLGIVALVVLSSFAPVLAQNNFATLSGAIQDPQGGPVSGAKLSLKATATGESRSVTVNATGLFEIAGLKPGEYRLEVRASGFANVERTVELEVGQQMR